MKLRRSLDRERNRTLLHKSLLSAFASVMCVPSNTVNSYDRQEHMMPYSRAPLGRKQVAGGLTEQLRGRGRIRCHQGSRVHDHLYTVQGLVEPLARDHVRAARSRHIYYFVAHSFERCHGMLPRKASSANDRNSHRAVIVTSSPVLSNADERDFAIARSAGCTRRDLVTAQR